MLPSNEAFGEKLACGAAVEVFSVNEPRRTCIEQTKRRTLGAQGGGCIARVEYEGCGGAERPPARAPSANLRSRGDCEPDVSAVAERSVRLRHVGRLNTRRGGAAAAAAGGYSTVLPPRRRCSLQAFWHLNAGAALPVRRRNTYFRATARRATPAAIISSVRTRFLFFERHFHRVFNAHILLSVLLCAQCRIRL